LCELDDLVDAMRRIVIANAAALAILAAGSITPNHVEAMTVTTPSGIQNALNENSLLQDVQVACRRVWRCGPYGRGRRRVCWRAASYYGGYGYYGAVRTTAAIVVGGGN
jgi:hypothetical protein